MSRRVVALLAAFVALGCQSPWPAEPYLSDVCERDVVRVESFANVEVDTCWLADRATIVSDEARGMGFDVGDALASGELVVTTDPLLWSELWNTRYPSLQPTAEQGRGLMAQAQAFHVHRYDGSYLIVAKPGSWAGVWHHELGHAVAHAVLGHGDGAHQEDAIWEDLMSRALGTDAAHRRP